MRTPIQILPLFLFVSKSTATEETFVNYHDSIDVGGPFEKLFRPVNNAPNAAFQSQDFCGGLQELHDILAQTSGAQVRAFGSQWSLSNVAYTRDVAIATDRLTYALIGLEVDHVDPAYESIRDQLVFCQTGVKIKSLSQALKEVDLSLTTTGGADGQTIGGAIGTGTHGSDSLNGAMPSFVRGMHFVLSETQHVFVQRSSDPVVTPNFVDWISENSTTPALFLSDDNMFDACLIHLGSMGLLHAVVLQAEPWFALQTQFKVFHYDDIKEVLSSLDVEKLRFDRAGHITDPNEFPYHLSVSINPYKPNKSYVGMYDKLPISGSSHARISGAAVQSKDLFETTMEQVNIFFITPLQWLVRLLFVNPFTNFFKRIIYGIIIAQGASDYYSRQASNSGGGLGDIFSFAAVDSFPFPTTNLEVYVSSNKATEVVEIFLDIVKRRVFVSGVNVRYIRPSAGTLESTRFGPLTAAIDVFGPWDDWLFSDTEDTFEEIFTALAARKDDIPHCWHWGKKLPKDDGAWIDWCLGSDKDAWINQRKILLDPQQQDMFSNEYLESLGLHESGL